jgi:endonuclease/exonuclease/phosphatase family metal-dependent hydrolase
MVAASLVNPRTVARRLPIALALVAALVLFWLLPTIALAHGGGHGHHKKSDKVRVMTRNIYLGADLGPGLAAPGPTEFFAANGEILRQVTRTNFPLRAEALAKEIKREEPDLVGLQEVALWRTAPPSLNPVFAGPSATTVRYDFLQLLLDQLNKHKQRYTAVVEQPEFDFEAPADENDTPGDGPSPDPTGGFLADTEINGRLTMRDVILARKGTDTMNPQAGHFENLLEVTAAGVVPIEVTRGWTTVDAKVHKSRWFHFVNTHLEAFDDETQVPSIRAQQAGELIATGGPARSTLPVILVGDLNSDRDTEVQPGDAQAYNVIAGAGFVNRDTSNPLSCCLSDPNLVGGSLADFDHKVDHVMTSSPNLVELQRSVVVGLGKVNGLFPSDHAGIASKLRIKR